MATPQSTGSISLWMAAIASLAIGFVCGVGLSLLNESGDKSNEKHITPITIPQSLSGDLWDTKVDDRIFRLCAQLPDEANPSGMYLWAQEALYQLRRDWPDRDEFLERRVASPYYLSLVLAGEKVSFGIYFLPNTNAASDVTK